MIAMPGERPSLDRPNCRAGLESAVQGLTSELAPQYFLIRSGYLQLLAAGNAAQISALVAASSAAQYSAQSSAE
eukprot:1154892-Pelagomonas_calceolata.AAC.5